MAGRACSVLHDLWRATRPVVQTGLSEGQGCHSCQVDSERVSQALAEPRRACESESGRHPI